MLMLMVYSELKMDNRLTEKAKQLIQTQAANPEFSIK